MSMVPPAAHRSRLLPWPAAVALALLLANCSSSPAPHDYPKHLVGAGPSLLFKHVVIDEHPPAAERECCTDVLALGDLNGDGLPDVVVGAEHARSDGLVWYAGPDWTRHDIGDGNFTTDGVVADMDADGDQDVVVSEADPNRVEWWENRGSPDEPSNWTRHIIADRYAHDLAVVDLDGDGRLDVVKSAKGGQGGWFQAPPDPTVSWSFHLIPGMTGEGLDVGDIDGDGDIDIASSRNWYENTTPERDAWPVHEISPDWGKDCRVRLADMNADGVPDVVLSHSEGPGRLSWFERMPDDTWREHPVEADTLRGTHSLDVGDMDGDGDLDILAGEMHTSRDRRVLVYENRGDTAWARIELSARGTHNARLGDIDGDGDLDAVGKNYAGGYRPVELWENLSADTRAASPWTYVAIDDDRPDDQRGKMGLVFVDADHDGYPDVAAGSFLYLNPGADARAPWRAVRLPGDVDTYFAVDVDGDAFTDLVGIRADTLRWMEAADTTGQTWTDRPLAAVPDGRTQGYVAAQIVPGGRPELVFTRGKNLFYLQIPPADPQRASWTLTRVSRRNEEEGVAAGDVDRDGDIDLVAYGADGHHVLWFENAGSGGASWARHPIGTAREWMDRIALVDLNDDGRLDVVVTEETGDRQFNAHLFWFEAPADPRADDWRRHTVTVLRSINSMDVADMDGDGDPDLVVAEHTDRGKIGAPDNLTLVLENRRGGRRWAAHVVEMGEHSSHLGARVRDLDGDDDLDIVSLGWGQYRTVHAWINPASHVLAVRQDAGEAPAP